MMVLSLLNLSIFFSRSSIGYWCSRICLLIKDFLGAQSMISLVCLLWAHIQLNWLFKCQFVSKKAIACACSFVSVSVDMRFSYLLCLFTGLHPFYSPLEWSSIHTQEGTKMCVGISLIQRARSHARSYWMSHHVGNCHDSDKWKCSHI